MAQRQGRLVLTSRRRFAGRQVLLDDLSVDRYVGVVPEVLHSQEHLLHAFVRGWEAMLGDDAPLHIPHQGLTRLLVLGVLAGGVEAGCLAQALLEGRRRELHDQVLLQAQDLLFRERFPGRWGAGAQRRAGR